MVKRLAVLGSTGSIGTQTLDIIRKFPDRLSVVGLAAGRNTSLLAQQIAEFGPLLVSAPDSFTSPSTQRLSPEEIATHPEVDIVVIAIPGEAALTSVMAAVSAGKVIALANKESLVSAGDIIIAEAERTGATIRPVDSEHSAIWQCLAGESTPPTRLILTASGGPFRTFSPAELATVSIEDALRHPSWSMGHKVTVDSATLLNKGLEIIEAHHLFRLPFEKIEVVVHPQSIVHSLVEFGDGSLKAQLSQPNMRLPIQYALSYPERWDNLALPRLDLVKTGRLDFEPPDHTRFPCLALAIEAGKSGSTYPAVLCAAGERAVELFLAREIGFTDIASAIEGALMAHKPTTHPLITDVMAAVHWAKETVGETAKKERSYY
ncbi:MAG: 1-deoxy-D-xylulose-5-phosphate reductoisomerase [Dehalococcoidia bacterium]|nr:1-deoxy-D-xylulose-5-phosphate reductoisomerase [Dehalococcoidia bacterium]